MRNKQKIDIETYLRKKRKKREFMEERYRTMSEWQKLKEYQKNYREVRKNRK